MKFVEVEDFTAATAQEIYEEFGALKAVSVLGGAAPRVLGEALSVNILRLAQAFAKAHAELDACHLRDVRDEQTIAELRNDLLALKAQMREDERIAAEAAAVLVKQNSRLRMQLIDMEQERREERREQASGK